MSEKIMALMTKLVTFDPNVATTHIDTRPGSCDWDLTWSPVVVSLPATCVLGCGRPGVWRVNVNLLGDVVVSSPAEKVNFGNELSFVCEHCVEFVGKWLAEWVWG